LCIFSSFLLFFSLFSSFFNTLAQNIATTNVTIISQKCSGSKTQNQAALENLGKFAIQHSQHIVDLGCLGTLLVENSLN